MTLRSQEAVHAFPSAANQDCELAETQHNLIPPGRDCLPKPSVSFVNLGASSSSQSMTAVVNFKLSSNAADR